MAEHLGDFGTAHPAVEQTFGWFGTTVRVHPDLSDLTFIDLMAAAAATVGAETADEVVVEAIQAVASLASALVHPDDFAEFWAVTRAHRQTMADLMQLAMALIGGVTGRPTRLPSDSSAGQPPTGTSSTAASSSPALHLLDGRPDLQVAVLRAEEARRAG